MMMTEQLWSDERVMTRYRDFIETNGAEYVNIAWQSVICEIRDDLQQRIAELEAALEARDAEIERLYGACKRLSENEQYKHRLWVQAMQETDTVRRMAALESILNLPTVGWSANSEN